MRQYLCQQSAVSHRMHASILFLCLLLSGFCARCQNYFGEYRLRNGLCSTTFTLWEDSTYFMESGCEGRSHIVYGTISIHHQQLILKPISRNQAPLIHQVSWLSELKEFDIKMGENSVPNLILSDKSGQLIRNMKIVLYDSDGFTFTFEGLQEVGKAYPLGVAEEVYFPELSRIFRKFISVKVPKKPIDKHLLQVIFNINPIFLTYDSVTYFSELQETTLQIRGDTLIARENGQLFKLEKVD